MMTRLHVDVLCERCDKVIGVSTGSYFGSQTGDQPIRDGLCLSCVARSKGLEDKK